MMRYQSKKMKLMVSYLTILLILPSICHASFKPRLTFQLQGSQPPSSSMQKKEMVKHQEKIVPDNNNNSNDDNDTKRMTKKDGNDTSSSNNTSNVFMKLASMMVSIFVSSGLSIYYGLGLLLYGQYLPNQILAITVLKVTGLSSLESAIRKMRINFRDAIASTLKNSPSLVMFAKTILTLNERKEMATKIMQETKKAKADGKITIKEASHISKLQRKQLRNINRDIRRLKRGTNSILQIWKALDFYEIAYIAREVVLDILLVVSSIHGDFFLGNLLKFYCIFVHMSRVIFRIVRHLGFPISTFLIQLLPFFPEDQSDDDVDPQDLHVIQLIGKTWVYMLTGFITYFYEDLAITINQALLAASITMHGITSIRRTMTTYKKENNHNHMDSLWTGIFTICLTAIGIYFTNNHDFLPKLTEQEWLGPILYFESFIEKSRTVVHNALGCQTTPSLEI